MANVGSLDRTLRFVLGAILLASPFLPATVCRVLRGLGCLEVRRCGCRRRDVGNRAFPVLPGLHASGHPDLPHRQILIQTPGQAATLACLHSGVAGTPGWGTDADALSRPPKPTEPGATRCNAN